MRNPLIAEIRRIRAKLVRERAQNPHRDAVAESFALLHKICDVVVAENGEQRYVASATKMHDVLIAPRVAKEAARSKSRVRARTSTGHAA